MIEIKKANTKKEIETNFMIRHIVFHNEMGIDSTIDFDEIDNHKECEYYLAYYNNEPVGAARVTNNNSTNFIERVCVLKKFRNKGIGKKLIEIITDEHRKELSYSIISMQHNSFIFDKLGFKSQPEKYLLGNEGLQFFVPMIWNR